MAEKIKLLPDTVANQIAAGEVVNRPASVVKEMLENAVDAGSRSVTVSYRNGGKELVKIIDDGEGMSPVDARLAFDKHATSKISTIDDIYALHTFGFRGEALASIAAIAHVELLTRPRGEEFGTRTIMEGSRFCSQEVVACPEGSQFSVKNLFYNVPARRRVLEKSTVEPRHIAEEFRRVALCHPEIAFALYGEGATIYNLPVSNLKQRIVGLMGKHAAGNLLEVSTDTSLVKISGFVGRPSSARQTNREQYMFVNGRFFKSAYFHKAVMQAYEKLIPAGTQPPYFLYFEVDSQRVDVNIHPQKIEVNFEDGVAIWQIVNASVRESLAKTGAVSLMDFDETKSVDIPVLSSSSRVEREPVTTTNPSYNPFRMQDRPAGRGSRADLSDFVQPCGRGRLEEMDATDALSRFDSSVVEFIEGGEGQAEQGSFGIGEKKGEFVGLLRLAGGYLATSKDGELVVIDLQRAKEALLYDRYLTMIRNESSVSQKLLFAERMVFSKDDTVLLQENSEELYRFGFEYRIVDDNTIELTGIPADFDMEIVQELLYDMIDALRDGVASGTTLRREYLAGVLSKGGARNVAKRLSDGELEAILASLAGGDRYGFTADGRPVMTVIPFDELKKRFTRQ